MKYRIRDLLNNEIVTDEGYYLTRNGKIEHVNTIIGGSLTVETCTGVQDINGIDIYEGDIVHVQDNGIKWTVEYGSFGDSKFYACNGLNSCREIEEDGGAWFSITYNRVDCEVLVDYQLEMY